MFGAGGYVPGVVHRGPQMLCPRACRPVPHPLPPVGVLNGTPILSGPRFGMTAPLPRPCMQFQMSGVSETIQGLQLAPLPDPCGAISPQALYPSVGSSSSNPSLCSLMNPYHQGICAMEQDSQCQAIEIFTPRQPPTAFCKFCKSNNETSEYYFSHNFMENGKVACPVLRRHVCDLCGGTGDNAHTKKYCPTKKSKWPSSESDENKDDAQATDDVGKADKSLQKLRNPGEKRRGIIYGTSRSAAGRYNLRKF